MSLYFQVAGGAKFPEGPHGGSETASRFTPVTTEKPAAPEIPPSHWIALHDPSSLNLLQLDSQDGRETLATAMADIPLYRISLELLVDRILLEARHNDVRAKGVRQAFAPEDPPEPIADPMAERYAFAGVLHFPVIASRTDAQLIELYLRLYGSACPEHPDPQSHLAAMLGGYPARLAERCDGVLWRGQGWVRLDCIVYDGERMDIDSEVTFESYVTRGRAGAEALAVNDAEALLAAWIGAERVQRELAHDIDSVLKLQGIRRLPRWVRGDVFRMLEREAMKQVFAEGLVKSFGDWPALRRARNLSEPIEANAKGEVAPLIQQLMNQTLSVDSRYSGAAEMFVQAAERRHSEARKLLGHK